MAEEKVLCRTPTPGKKPTSIDGVRFELYRRAILKVLRANGAPMYFRELFAELEDYFAEHAIDTHGSVAWNATTVKLELEVRGEIERVPKVTPQQLRIAKIQSGKRS